MNRHEEMARAACDALGLKLEETSPAEIKARVYEMWDGLNAKLAEPVHIESVSHDMPTMDVPRCDIRPVFRAVEWKPEDRDRRLRELVETFEGTVFEHHDGEIEIEGVSMKTAQGIVDLMSTEFPSAYRLTDNEGISCLLRMGARLPLLPSSQETPGG